MNDAELDRIFDCSNWDSEEDLKRQQEVIDHISLIVVGKLLKGPVQKLALKVYETASTAALCSTINADPDEAKMEEATRAAVFELLCGRDKKEG